MTINVHKQLKIKLLISLMMFFIAIFVLINTSFVVVANTIDSNFKEVAHNKKLILYCNQKTGEFILENKIDQQLWYSNPSNKKQEKVAKGLNKTAIYSQIVVDYVDDKTQYKANSYVSSVRRKGMKIQILDNGFKVIYNFVKEGFLIPVKYTIVDDYLKAEILVSEIEENSENQIWKIDLLPFFGAGYIDDSGYLFVPDGSGALVKFNNNKQRFYSYDRPIYCEDVAVDKEMSQTYKEDIHMPVFGINKNNKGILAVVQKGSAVGRIKASVSKKITSYNQINCAFEYRIIGEHMLTDKNGAKKMLRIIAKEPNDSIETYEVRYYPLSDEKCNYTKLAKRYQKYLIDEKGLQPNKFDQNIPLYIEFYGAIMKKKTFFGFPVNRLQPLTTYEQAQNVLTKLEQKGLKDIVVKYNGWMNDGLTNKKIRTNVSVENGLGGINDFNKLIKFSKENKIELYPDIDLLRFTKSGNGISAFFDSIIGLSGTRLKQYKYLRSSFQKDIENIKPWYFLSSRKIEEVVDDLVSNYKKYELFNISVNDLGNIIYTDFRDDMYDREYCMNQFDLALSKVQNNIGNVLVDNANDYAFDNCKHIINVPVYSSDFDIFDETVPFYQIVMHGYKSYSIPTINFSSEPKKLILKALETGSSLLFSLTGEDTSVVKETKYDYLYSTFYKNWLDTIEENYTLVNDILKKVQSKKIVAHEKLEENVFKTTYEGGISIIVNYKDLNYKIMGVK